MRVRFVYAALLLLWILCPVAIPADEPEPSASQRGITTKKNLEESIENQSVTPIKSTDSDAKVKGDGDKPPKPASTVHQDRRWIIRETPPNSRKVKKVPAKSVKWKNNTQKKQCESYLEKLGSAFLKARYYSIQGDSCACAENAGQFLSLHEKTSQACPDNYLEYEGYSSRITRNMGWLKALGERRCFGPDAVTHHPPEQKTDQIPDASHKGLGKHSSPSAVTPPGE